jgi:hypothetical protein
MGIMDTNFVWFVDNDKIYKLSDGLDNPWQIYQTGLFPSYTARFIDISTGYLSDGFKLLKSTNGGVNWVQIMADFNSGALTFIHVPNSGMLVAGNQGYIRISYDFGSNWEPTVAPGFYTHYADAFDTNSIWIAAQYGRLLKYNFGYIVINPIGTEIPKNFNLYQNYPNPFNPSTKIRFDISMTGNIKFIVYDALGREVYSLDEYKPAGSYEITFDGANLASGIYYYSVSSGRFRETKKMLLVK